MTAAAEPKTELSTRRLIALTIILFCGPVVCDLVLSGRSTPFHYFAADAFYYLTVGRNLSDRGLFSYDQTYSTNGFHPLWQVMVGGLFWISHRLGISDSTILFLVVLLGMTGIAVGIWLFGRALVYAQESMPICFLLFPIGAYGIGMAPLWLRYGSRLAAQNHQEGSMPVYGTLWSYANGMESALAILMFGLAVYLYTCRPPLARYRDAALFGLSLGLLTLARLDLGFLAVALLGGVFAELLLQRQWRRGLGFLITGASFAILPGIYCLINIKYFQSPVPISGSLKSSFPFIAWRNFGRLVWLTGQLDSPIWLAVAYRELQMFIPVVVAALYPLSLLALVHRTDHSRRRVGLNPRNSRIDYCLLMAAIGVVFINGYNILYVDMWGQGNWYYPVSTLFPSLVVLRVVQKSGVRLPEGRIRQYAVMACALLVVVGFLALHRKPDYHQNYADFYYEEAPRIHQHYGDRIPQIVEVDDGIIAFSLGYPTMSGLGFCLDRQAALAKRRGQLFPLAHRRGFDRIASLVYLNGNLLPLRPDSPPVQIAHALVQSPAEVGPFQFTLDYLSPSGRFAIARLVPLVPAAR